MQSMIPRDPYQITTGHFSQNLEQNFFISAETQKTLKERSEKEE